MQRSDIEVNAMKGKKCPQTVKIADRDLAVIKSKQWTGSPPDFQPKASGLGNLTRKQQLFGFKTHLKHLAFLVEKVPDMYQNGKIEGEQMDTVKSLQGTYTPTPSGSISKSYEISIFCDNLTK